MKKYKVISEEYTPSTVYDLIKHMIKPYRLKLVGFFVLTLIGVVAWTGSTYVASLVISNLGENPEVDAAIWWLVVTFAVLRVGDEVFWRLSEVLMRNVKPQMVERVRTALYQATAKKTHSYFVNSSSGRIAHWINQTTETMSFLVDTTIWTVWGRVTGMIIATIFLFTAHWSLALLFITWLVILFWFNMKRGVVFSQLVEKQGDEASKASGLVVDTISNNLSMRVFNTRHHEQDKLIAQQNQIVKRYRTSWKHNIITNVVKGQSAAIVNVIAMILALVLFANGSVGLGGLVLFLAYFNDASSSLWQLAWSLDQYYRQFGMIQNALDGLSGEDERQGERTKGTDIPDKVTLSLSRLSFAYPEQPKENVLQKINLEVKAGEKVGIVGHSGAGKSTLVGLLLGFYEPTSGSISVNTIDIASKDPSFIRSVSSLVPQDTNLFNRTIRENVAYARQDAKEEDIVDALKKAEAHEFVMKLPDGLDTLVGERGVKLSGGQRQRIAIARAILRDAPLLILDEATSALDSVSEQAIQKALHELMKGRTALVIAHRLSTLKHLDRIYVMEEGVIVESGTHTELVKIDGIYADLWRRQKDGFIVD